MIAIYAREVKSYFNNMLGYIVCAFMIAVIGLYFMANNLYSGYPYFAYAIINCARILVFALPILTMKCFSEERKSKTDQMLLTAPVRLYEIVLAKYLAMVTVYLIPMIVSFICPLIIKINGDEGHLRIDYLSIFTMFILGCVFIAIGMFLSSLTESQIIAAVAAFAIVFAAAMWSSLLNFIPSTAMASSVFIFIAMFLLGMILEALLKNWYVAAGIPLLGMIATAVIYTVKSTKLENFIPDQLSKINLFTPLEDICTNYIFDLSGILMYLSIIFIFIMLTIQVIYKRRWS